jgi:GNAT superfamily N-acetyltransferase
MVSHDSPVVIEPFQEAHLFRVQLLINMHLSTMAPGWGLPEAFIARCLHRNPYQETTDPWVRERMTLCALQKQRVVAAAHLLRYGNGPEVNPYYQNAGDLAWFLVWPNASEAAAALLAAARRQFAAWQVTHEYAWDAGVPVGPFVGVPDAWPHISRALEAAGYAPRTGKKGEESVYGGSLDVALSGDTPPVAGLTLQRVMGKIDGACFLALVDGEVVGQCECATDLTRGGMLPALRGWGELSEVEVQEPWRRRGIGTWLVRQAVAWHHLGGGTHLIFAVLPEDEEAGAGRFYQRLGWQVLVRQRKGWQWHDRQATESLATT